MIRLLERSEFEALFLNESFTDYEISINEHIKYHIENGLTISDSIFRVGSDSYLDFVNEMRRLHTEGKIKVSEEDQFILEKLYTGKKGTYTDSDSGKKKTVTLDDPRLSPPDINTLYYVYRPSKSGEKDKDTGLPKAIMIGFGEKTGSGQPDVRDKHQDPGKRSQFLARHNCKEKDDPYASGWWSCNIHKWYKQLGLKTADPW
jgi:hypothetical protein